MKTFTILLVLLTMFSLNTSAQDVPNTVLSDNSMADVYGVVFSPDGSTLASKSADRTIRLWSVTTGTHRRTLSGFMDDVRSIAMSPDGSTIASGSADGTIRLWRVTTGTHRQTLSGHTDNVYSVVFSPDGTTLASGSKDGTIRLWDVERGTRKAIITLIGSEFYDVIFSPDGTTLASRSSNDSTIRLWDVATGTRKYTLSGHGDYVYSVVFSPDGQSLASGSADDTVRLWDVATGTLNHTLGGHRGNVNTVVFSPDGQSLASGSADDTVRLWDVATGTRKYILEGHRDLVRNVVFNPAGNVLASGSNDDTIRLWDVETGSIIDTLEGHGADVNTVAFSPNGNVLASGSDDDTIRLWEIIYTHIRITPERVVSPIIGDNFSIDINIAAGEDVGGYQLTLGFDPTALRYVSSANGDYLTDGSYFIQPIAGNNSVTLGATNFAQSSSGDGVLATITFEVVDVKNSTLNLSNFLLMNSNGDDFLGRYVHNGGIVQPPPVATTAIVRVTPSSVLSPARHQQFTLNVNIAGGQNIAAHRLFWGFDDEPLELLSGLPGNYLAGGIGNGDGTLFIGTFKVRAVKTSTVNVSGHLIGTDGLRYIPTFESATIVQPLFGDVNRDGLVNISDLVLVASSFNQRVSAEGNPADVNEDNVVNIVDLVRVAAVIGGRAAAPAALTQNMDVDLTRGNVQQWLTQAQQLNLTDASSQRGMLFLEQLLAALTPKQTSLLANYPNPSNPETWIPYQLATPAEVTLTIYAADGTAVRTLSLGHQLVGIYQSKSRAAYWDGKNTQGEAVASGVYFYTFSAGDFTATRKMLIRK